jgi:SEC-C motif-containing protein
LLNTWHPKTRPSTLDLETSPNQWIGLKIKHSERGKQRDSTGTVHFIARFKVNGKAQKLEENSQFEKINGRWLYLEGSFPH